MLLYLCHSSFLLLSVQNNHQPHPEFASSLSTVAPDDYTAVLNQTVTFDPSDETQIVQVMVNNDSIAETVEMFLGRLSLPDGSSGVVISSGDATATITDTNGK